ncbi:MAG TPA: DoxX family protein [Planctomycetaceae bacterium]|nr:DoxX family protein [Planctomycetaceae bacterium]
MSFTTRILAIVGRVMIATIFLLSAVGNKIPNFSQTVDYMSASGVPLPSLSLVAAIVFLVVGSVSIVLGYYARIGASLLLVFLILATYFFHNFWSYEGQEQQMQMIQFMKNLSMMGTMFFIMAVGSGPLSLDSRTVQASGQPVG